MRSPPALQPIRAAYIDSRDVVFSRPDLAIRRAVAQGFNVIFISFVRPSAGAVSIVDACEAWEAAFSSLGRAAIAATVASAHANGTVLLASAGGSTETPYGLVDAAWYGRFVTQWAQANLLDGVGEHRDYYR